MLNIRHAAVAGSFYPRNPVALANDIDAMLKDAEQRNPPLHGEPLPKALIVPHAGYVYSGPIAAGGYLRLRKGAGSIRRVILLGPVHYVPVRGMALPTAAAFETPLGTVPVDAAAIKLLDDLPQVIVSNSAHAREHSLEVQIPFLQRVLGKFSLVPLAVGDCRADAVAEVLERLWGGPESIMVISSDLSHYLPYNTARRIDHDSVQTVLDLQILASHGQACGATPVNGLITAARKKGLIPKLIDLRNSGDTAGDRLQVVGYASIAFYEEVPQA